MSKIKNSLICLLFLMMGLLFFFWPFLVYNFDLMPGRNVDTRLITYIFEHSWLWVTKESVNQSLWDMPFLYPEKNTLAISDTFISSMPFYWVIRNFVSNPFDGLQVLYVLFSIFNYSTFYYLLKKQLKFSSLASAMGAFIFAFGLMRFYRIGHFQFFTQFYTILSLIFLIKTINGETKKNILNFGFASLFLVLQFYSAYCLAFYYVFVLCFVLIFCFLYKKYKEKTIQYLKNNWKIVLSFAIVSLIALLPLAYHYLSQGVVRKFDDILQFTPTVQAWFNGVSLLDNLFLKFENSFSLVIEEHSCSIGILTLILSLIGLLFFKKNSLFYYLTLFFVFINSCYIGKVLIWKYFYYIFPGSSGIRCIVRISFIALIILAIGVAKLIDNIKFKNKILQTWVLIIVSLIIILEQFPCLKSFNSNWISYSWTKKDFIQKVDTVAKSVPENCKILYLDDNTLFDQILKKNIDIDFYTMSTMRDYNELLAMWASLKKGIPTLNGYNGLNKVPNIKIKEDYCVLQYSF